MRKMVVSIAVVAAVFLAGLGISTRVFADTGALTGAQAAAQAGSSARTDGCDDYAIMRCGASSAREFINKASNNKAGDLQNVYSDYGLVPGDYSRFVTDAKAGTLYNDGRIVVDGVVVGHSTQNVGRVQDSKFTQKVTIAGKNYWGGSFGSTYHANTAPVMVLFNDKGVMQFAVISSCGNPQRITAEKPTYSCDQLQKSPVAGSDNTYSFTTAASATKGATLVKAVYDFGDGTSQTVTNLSQAVQHTFTKDSHVTVKVYVKLPGGNTVVTPVSTDCSTDITFKAPPTPQQPYARCTSVDSPTLTDAATRAYSFTAYADYGNGAVFNNADVNFGDGVTAQKVMPDADGKRVIVSHAYGAAGNYTVTFTLHFSNSGGSALPDATCQTQLSPADVVQYCKPGVPVGSPDCAPPAVLTNTGPGEIAAGLFAGFGAIAGISHFVIRRRLGL